LNLGLGIYFVSRQPLELVRVLKVLRKFLHRRPPAAVSASRSRLATYHYPDPADGEKDRVEQGCAGFETQAAELAFLFAASLQPECVGDKG
jgi:hypothetical protein